MDGISDSYTFRRSVELVCSLIVSSQPCATELCSRLSNWHLSQNGKQNLSLIHTALDSCRSCHDAVQAIFSAIKSKAKYVLDADIAKCFDRINHEALLNKLKTFPTIRRQIRSWLKAGVMDGKQLFPTSEGTPQGGVISPLLANIALHGMEERIKNFVEKCDLLRSDGKYQLPTREKRSSISIIRYADDFVILHEDITVVQRCREVISEWLKDMALELKPSKTRLAHTLNKYEEEQPGFNFLGFNTKQFPVSKYQSGNRRVVILLLNSGEQRGFFITRGINVSKA